MAQFSSGNILYELVLDSDIKFSTALKVLPTKGNLVYEYNPFRNYRLSKTGYQYKNRIYSPKELLQELGREVNSDEEALQLIGKTHSWESLGVPDSETDPVLIESGELTDFETEELQFDLNHPVSILPQYSYDNSVNLIINDGKNKPRLINSRFSATEKNKYLIVDRKGNNDTNIYDQGPQFDVDTSLYKLVIEIPRLRLVGINEGGRLPIGNYHFYFRYADADGNETDFVAESGLVSLFIGSNPTSISGGFRDEDSHKLVRLMLSNIDSSYQYVYVYYTRSTSDIYLNPTVTAFKINQKFLVNNLLNCDITITGYEDVTQITVEEINPMYQIADAIGTLELCLNMLFLGNIQKPEIQYQELSDLSLRFLPCIKQEDYPLLMDSEYNVTSTSFGYYDPKFIYNKVGYWNHEIYRLGIVYILSDNSLSPVFNVRGIENLNDSTEYSKIDMYKKVGDEKVRNYIVSEEETYKIITEESSYGTGGGGDASNANLENSKGVILLNMPAVDSQLIYSINFKVNYEVLDYLTNVLNIKGFFFVRLKRIPTILCLAYTIGVDKESNTPVLPVEGNKYISERFINDSRILDNEFEDRIYTFEKVSKIRLEAAICPEYDVDSAYLNTLFSGNTFTISEADVLPGNPYLSRQSNRNFYIEGNSKGNPNNIYESKIIGVEDNVKLVAINDKMFSARAGEAEEAFRYEYLEKENKISEASNLVRGSYGPYLGIVGYNYSGKIIDIKIPGYSKMTYEDLFKIRYADKSLFYAISERIDLKHMRDWFTIESLRMTPSDEINLLSNLYRGDCYICQFTHRLNRNFLDPSAPINDKIVDANCWKDNYEISDNVLKVEKFEKINLGDVNAVKLGMWVTITIRSTKNLNIRSIDTSVVDEMALTGHPRGFFPYLPVTADGAYKTPEALCYNKGFEKSISERYNFEVPDVPAIKNDFTNRISYSDIHVNDAFKNGFRVFLGTHYRDYPKTYGSITKLIELRGNLICIFEHGVALIPVNERAVAGEGSGGNVYINTSNVLPENPKIISDTFGSLWKDSVIKTPMGVYGVDTIGKKIWRTNGDTFECISDFKVQEFLNLNISLKERELDPVIGIRNVKTHYNKFKGDVMFTFYDNLHGFEEKVWNLCYNELQQKWITFYSWIPSYSENIYNLFFSFDRNTSKWISKLGVSHFGNDFSDGVTLENNIIEESGLSTKLHLSNRTKAFGDDVEYQVTYELDKDNFGNYKLFNADKVRNDGILEFIGKYEDVTSEFYLRDSKGSIVKDERGRRIWLDPEHLKNPDKVVLLLNIKAHIKISYNGLASLGEAYASGFTNQTFTDAGYYQSVVAVIPKYNMQFLTTDFWKHGLAGIIDIADTINPTYWYGKQHPFEFEFVVADNPQVHKIFDNLEIISNNAEPESFHYEIIGDCFDFANDKKNMYIRQEATKELYLNNGFDVLYDKDYVRLNEKLRPLLDELKTQVPNLYDKSTLFPLYYSRRDSFNEIEDFYHLKDNIPTKDFSALAGAEIVKYNNLGEYRIWNHAKAIDLNDRGRIRGNMLYLEDKWLILINPINLVLKNEPKWANGLVPVELNQSPIPDLVLDYVDYNNGNINIPEDFNGREVVVWNWLESLTKEVKMKDKWIKIRIRYKGDKLAIITAIRTLYSASYA